MLRTSLLLALLCAPLLAGCKKSEEEPVYSPAPAGAAPEAPPSSLEPAPADEGPSFSSVEEAQAALARAEQDLLTLAPPATPPASAGASAPGPAATSAPGGGDRAPEAPAEAAPEPKKDEKAAADRCAGLCRAFGSLSRAADAICRLAGENDERCTSARGKVRGNFTRISVCRCPPP